MSEKRKICVWEEVLWEDTAVVESQAEGDNPIITDQLELRTRLDAWDLRPMDRLCEGDTRTFTNEA